MKVTFSSYSDQYDTVKPEHIIMTMENPDIEEAADFFKRFLLAAGFSIEPEEYFALVSDEK